MTAEAILERIVTSVMEKRFSGRTEIPLRQQLKSYGDARFEEGVHADDFVHDQIRKEARNSAIEDAANLVSERCGGNHDDIPDEGVCAWCKLADDVLALKSKPAGGE